VATASILAIRSNNPSFRALGASGSIAGVLFTAIVLRPEMDLFLMFLPIPIPAPVFAVLYIALSTYLMGRQGSRVCHEAHVGGAIAGVVLGALLAPRGLSPLIERVLGLIS
jgi:membrane associated rhomboid family serine protease